GDIRLSVSSAGWAPAGAGMMMGRGVRAPLELDGCGVMGGVQCKTDTAGGDDAPRVRRIGRLAPLRGVHPHTEVAEWCISRAKQGLRPCDTMARNLRLPGHRHFPPSSNERRV